MSAAVVGLVGVVLGSFLTNFKDLVTHFLKRRSKGRYAAVRLVAILNEYAQKCVSVVADDGTCEGRPAGRTSQGEEYLEAQVTTPSYPNYPEDIDWQSISFKLMYRVLSLPNTAQETDRYIDGAAEHSFPPDYEEFFSARQEGYANLGVEAIRLVEELRKEFDLPSPPKHFWDWGWDTKKYFEDKITEFEKRRQASLSDGGII